MQIFSAPMTALFAALACCGGARAQDAPAPPVAVAMSEMAEIVEQIPLTGSVYSPRISSVSVEIGGRIEDMHIDSGSRVKEGDLLVSLDNELTEIALKQAQGATRAARAEVADAQRRLAQSQRLAKNKYTPETAVELLESEVETDSAMLVQREAEEATQAARLERMRVRAPFAGVVSQKMTEAGAWIQPGNAVVELVATEGLRIDVPVPQSYFPRLSDDTHVTVRLDALPDQELEAKLVAAIPVSDPNARTFTARVVLARNDVAMTPGMSAQIVFHFASGAQGVVIPRDGMLRHPDGRITAWVIADGDEGPAAEERQIEIGLIFNGRVEIRKGIESGERIVVRGNESLRPGQRVRIEGEAS